MRRNNFNNKWSSVIGKVRTFAKNRIAYINQLSSKGWWYYGTTDDLPNIIIEGINNSGTATQALKRKRQFIQAEGFKCQITADAPIDKKNGTFNSLLGEISENTVKLEGFALNLFFNSEGKIASMKSIPITWIRKKTDDTYIVNRLMGEQNYRKTDDVVLREFDPNEDYAVRAARVKADTRKNGGKQLGELFYAFEAKLGRNYDIYPVPSYYSGFDDIVSDGKISTLEMRNIVQGWRAPIVITTGQIDDVNLDENDRSDLDKFNESIEEFLGEEASPVMHLMGRTPEETPQVTTIDIKEIVDMTEKATIRVGEKVARLIGVPPVLIGFDKAGQLGNVQEIKNMMTLFYLTIREWQDWITRKLEMIQPCMVNGEMYDFEITRLNPFDFLPEKVIDMLSDEEVREFYELPKVQETVDDKAIASRFSEFGVGGVQGILGIQQSVSTGVISIDAGAKVLEVIYGFDKVQSYQMLGSVYDEQVEQVINTEDDIEQREVNEHLKTLTGKQQQQLDRVVRKHNKGDLNETQAVMQLVGGFGFTEDEARAYLGVEQEVIQEAQAILNQSYTDYPKAATENAQAALRWAEENGWGSCGTAVGKQRANQLAKGEPISEDTISRMASFERHRQNSDKELGDGCGRLMWLAWGGDEGVAWAQRKLEQINKEK